MKAERQGRKFHLQLDLIELLTLYHLIAEEKVRGTGDFEFENPDKIKMVLEDFYYQIQALVVERTPEVLQVRFYRP